MNMFYASPAPPVVPFPNIEIFDNRCCCLFLAELFCYLTENILGVEVLCGQLEDDMQTMCTRHADDMRVRFWVRFHWQMTYVIHMLFAHHPHTCLSCPISCNTTPDVICTLSADTHVIHTSSACHLHTQMSSACRLHVIHTLP